MYKLTRYSREKRNLKSITDPRPHIRPPKGSFGIEYESVTQTEFNLSAIKIMG